jgi:hypothetical protein
MWWLYGLSGFGLGACELLAVVIGVTLVFGFEQGGDAPLLISQI